jgi:hypothetical protein
MVCWVSHQISPDEGKEGATLRLFDAEFSTTRVRTDASLSALQFRLLDGGPTTRLIPEGACALELFGTKPIMSPNGNLSRVRKFGLCYVLLDFGVKNAAGGMNQNISTTDEHGFLDFIPCPSIFIRG